MTRARRSSLNLPNTLRQLEAGRKGAMAVCASVRSFSDEYKQALAVSDAIDNLAETLTGDREYFWLKGHG